VQQKKHHDKMLHMTCGHSAADGVCLSVSESKLVCSSFILSQNLSAK